MKTIVCLVDFSDAAPKVIEQAQAFAQAFNARVVLLHVAPKEHVVMDLAMVSPIVTQAPSPEAIKADFERLSALAQSLTQAGIAPQVEQLKDADVESLVTKCEQLEADLIVVGSHRHGALYQWLTGSMTSGVLKSARCAVLVVPAG